jgi:hypothetical protein
LLPFPKRTKSDEIELGDEDILLVESDDAVCVDIDVDVDVELEVAPPPSGRHRLPPVTAPPPKLPRPRLVSSPAFEDDVADQCLATIAAEASRARLTDRFPASIVPPPARMPPPAPLPSFDDDAIATSRLPVVTVPPPRVAVPYSRDSVPGVAAPPSGPAPAFVRTSSSSLPSAASSVAPVALTAMPEPTVIVVRQPPRTAWIVASAVVGAACALGAMRLLPSGPSASHASEPAPVVASPAPPPVLAPAVTATHASAAAPAVVKFAEGQGVAIVAPAIAPAAPPAAAPTHAAAHATVASKTPSPAPVAAKPAAKTASLGPKLPDGSMALGGAQPEPAKAAPAQTAQPAPAPPPSPAKRRLSPEQELAEAQLKASMK